MTPFVQPEEPTAADAIAAIGDELAVFDDWMERYQFIIELGRKLPPFPDAWANDAHRVPGCQSRVWMEGALTDGKLFLAGIYQILPLPLREGVGGGVHTATVAARVPLLQPPPTRRGEVRYRSRAS